ncbi:MAG: succinate dehydrogenase, cytochrome b556 subunit, partial [Telluria sp.]
MSEAVREAAKKGRPEFRNIGIGDITGKYRMPPSAIVSILH